MRVAATLLACLALAACTTTYEGLPAGSEDAPFWPKAAMSADFSYDRDLRTATRACIASETRGPAALASLQSQGFVRFSDMGQQGYMKSGDGTGPRRPDRGGVIRVSDPNARVGCKIEVSRNDGRMALQVISSEMVSAGYPLVTVGRFERHIGQGSRFIVGGTRSTYDRYANLRVWRTDATGDRTCRDASLSAAQKVGC